MMACIVFLLTGCLEPAPPRLESAGIGVSNLERSTDFYSRVIGMDIRCQAGTDTMDKVTLEFSDSKGSDLILMHYTDGSQPNYANNPVKLVFYVPDAIALAQAIAAEGLRILAWPSLQYGTLVGIAVDPDGYWIEIVEDRTAEKPYLGAVGIGVSDLESSGDFYSRVMGMTEQYRLSLGFMDEIILQIENGGGSAVVLMHYATPRNYKDLPVKLTYCVTDPQQTIEDIRGEGLEIHVSPRPKPKFNPLAYGLAKDPDGYLLEIVQSVQPRKETKK